MKFIRDSLFERAIRGISLRAIRRVERSGNANIDTNGEVTFLQTFLKFFLSEYPDRELIVVDGGAHVGHYLSRICSDALALKVKVTVHAFEPSITTFSELIRNQSSRQNVKFNNTALSDRNGTGTIHFHRDASSLASIYERDLRSVGLDMNQTESIQLTRLDAYIQRSQMKHLHLLKLDVEGSEYDAIRGLGSYLDPKFLDFIQFEYGGTNLDVRVPLKVFFDLFEKSGFVMARVFPQGLKVRAYASWMDNFEYANFVAISRVIYERMVDRH